MAVDPNQLNAFLGKTIDDIGAAMSVPLLILGERLGLYQAMRGAGPLTPAQLADKTHTAERYIREWLMNNAAGGYVQYDPQAQTFTLPDEQAMALADETSPCYMHGAYEIILSLFRDLDKFEPAFRNGTGLEWGEHDHCLFSGTARFFRPNYAGNLIDHWIPALDGVQARLRAGAVAADIGCGFGHSTMLLAGAYPQSTFIGFDYHRPSIDAANQLAKQAGLTNVLFQTAPATGFPGDHYDLVTCFDCLHDMADPAGVARHVRETLQSDGTWMIVEPFAEDVPEQNLNPLGRVFYAASTLICIPVSLAGHGPALGAQAGEKRLKQIVTDAGFTRFRRATQTQFNLVLEARP
jgi:SAM-dependent methyltransferase